MVYGLTEALSVAKRNSLADIVGWTSQRDWEQFHRVAQRVIPHLTIGLEPTPYSVHFAPAFRRGSGPALSRAARGLTGREISIE